MAPEIAAAYVAGLIPSSLVTGAHLLLFRKKIKSPPYELLQRNLKQVNLYWSEAAGSILELHRGKGERRADQDAYLRGLKILGLICFFMSWIGVFFHLIILLSLRYLAVPRLERALLRSSLVQAPLTTPQVNEQLAQIQSHVLNAKIPGF